MPKKKTGNNIPTFSNLYDKQTEFQKIIVAKKLNETEVDTFEGMALTKPEDIDLPSDNIDWYKYHLLAMMEEIGEVLQSDKRWKTHRNERFEKEEKLSEFADVFITFMNMSIFSGFSSQDILIAVDEKIKKNKNRMESK